MNKIALLTLLIICISIVESSAQKPKVNNSTVFIDSNGKSISKKEFRDKIKTDQYVVGDYKVSGLSITEISLRGVNEPEKEKLQSNSSKRQYHTQAPSFTTTDINGITYSTDQLKGKIVVVNFWFIKCPFCIEEMPELKRLAEKYKSDPTIVFISFAREKVDRLKKYVQERGDFGFAIIPQTEQIATQYDINSYPTTIVINQKGEFAYDFEGYPGNINGLEKAIYKLR
ncbi:TlpA disulfide reductase family protein [Cytophagaceae bacterium DM2B3-1]|uniref:TlpA disulfide reductase family protein n=1 Tax=Xanthocytophaga flava TaxID=3048013 RepID=A0ABT7D0V8_9BACT|nr:TlpA disulfide reductase family protein [Xanthocytophaga flavus]MDJ1498890.1 TlpA disulfide reductase family protein [Xanthocytophaga flavus]